MSDVLEKDLFDILGEDDSEIKDPKWTSYPKVADHMDGNTFYADIINHCKDRQKFDGIGTDCHETSHGVNADIRNKYGNGINPVAFYVGNDKCCIMPQPKIRKSVVAKYVPVNMRWSRYNLYILGQKEWDDSPLYLYDEWICYVNGGAALVEAVENNTYKGGWTDGVAGMLEFSVYCLCLVLAVEEYDPEYLNDTVDFLKYTSWCLKRSQEVYNKGSIMKEFKWKDQDDFFEKLKKSKEAESLRSLISRRFQDVFKITD